MDETLVAESEHARADERRGGARSSEGSERRGEGGEGARDDPPVAREIEGEWRLAQRDAEARIDRAVAEVTGQMNFFIRGIANGRIDEAVNPDERVMIEAADDGHVVVAVGRSRPVRLALNGPAVPTTSADGEPVRTRATLRDGHLSIIEQTEDGSRVLTFQPRGDALVMTARIRSDQLPADIVYGLRYRRTGGQLARR